MSSIRNRVQLIGNLGADPEIKEMESGRKMAKFSVATNEIYRNQAGDLVTETQWHRLIAWGRTAEIAEEYLKKGSEVAVDGKIQTRSYETEEGEQRYATEIVINELVMTGPKKKAG
ncbi:MAG: single-stranded DNA-binding protein [Flavobacteriales bacterium]|nr:single-stranded DNA-binding protein [Flavobacteriales bacterium]